MSIEQIHHRTRLLLLDDHTLFREGLVRLLSTEESFEIAAQCSSVVEALTQIRSRMVDLVLLDFDLGPETGLHFLSAASEAGYKGKILLVTAGVSPIDLALLKKQGVYSIFPKHGSPSDLLAAIHAAANGEKQMDLGLDDEIPEEALAGGNFLTMREHQVLRCVFEGLINKQIAARIGVSQSSVKATLQKIFAKTGVRTRSQLVRFAIERSLE